MTPGAASLRQFVVRTFLWLPPCFAAWYVSAPYHAAVAGELARIMVNLLTAGVVSALERSGIDLVFVTRIKVYPAPGQAALLLPEVNPLIYTYGLAFFFALMLAERAGWRKILVGAVILLPFQIWGIAFDFLSQVGVRLGPEVAAQAGLSRWHAEAIALGYQLGSLIFPSLVPVVLWGASSRMFIDSVLHSQTRHSPASIGS